MNTKRFFRALPAAVIALALSASCAPASSLRLVLSRDADVKAELERFIAWNRLEATARKAKPGEWEIVFARELPAEPSTPFVSLRDFIDFTDPVDPATMTLTTTEKNQDAVKELGIDDASRTLVYALDVDRGEFARYRYEIMDQAMEDRAWDVPLDKDPPVLHFTSEMRAGNSEAFTDDAVRQKFDDLLKKLSGLPRTAEHTLAFGPSRLTPDLGEVRAEFNGGRTVSFTFDTRNADEPLAPLGETDEGRAADAVTLGEKSSKAFKMIILFPKLATRLQSYSFRQR